MGLSGIKIYKSEEVSKEENEDEIMFLFFNFSLFDEWKNIGLVGKRCHQQLYFQNTPPLFY